MPDTQDTSGGSKTLRLLFVALVVLNILAGAWLLLGQPYRHVLPPTDPGVPELKLLSELPAQSATTAPTPATNATASIPAAASAPMPANSVAIAPDPPAAPTQCLALGPFASAQDLQSARTALKPQTLRTRSRQVRTPAPGDWWVYLTTPNQTQASALAKRLAARGIRDFAIGSVGNQPTTISLGVYQDETNARKRRSELTSAGFSARISQRNNDTTRYWLDLVAAHGPLDWRNRIHASGIDARTIHCF